MLQLQLVGFAHAPNSNSVTVVSAIPANARGRAIYTVISSPVLNINGKKFWYILE